jgi:hypothetical protein
LEQLLTTLVIRIRGIENRHERAGIDDQRHTSGS